tara:strand:- start:93 stop:1055 length:963 start_codon:yes stop_codon:yes gene_type:complete
MLVSAIVYAQDSTLTIFEIRDDNGNVLSDTTYQLIAGENRIYFNYEMTAGLDYELGVNGFSNNLFRTNAGVNYPYDFGTAASITSSSAGGNYYYFFYDVELLPYLYEYNKIFICDGDSITIGNSIYNTPGQYTDNFIANNSCDSTVFTVIDFYQSPALSIETNPNPAEICLGETVLLEASSGFTYYSWNNGLTVSIITQTPTVDTWYVVEAVDSNGCTIREDVWVYVDSCITEVNNLIIEEGIQLYPNPASEKVNIEFSETATSIKIYNMLGKLVFENKIIKGEHTININIKDWKSDIYSVQLFNKNKVVANKVFNIIRK